MLDPPSNGLLTALFFTPVAAAPVGTRLVPLHPDLLESTKAADFVRRFFAVAMGSTRVVDSLQGWRGWIQGQRGWIQGERGWIQSQRGWI
jgi:hypothetical protein